MPNTTTTTTTTTTTSAAISAQQIDQTSPPLLDPVEASQIDFHSLEKKIDELFKKEEYQLLDGFLKKMKAKQKFAGKKIIINWHLDGATLIVILVLLYGGANLTVTGAPGLIIREEYWELLKKANVKVRKFEEIPAYENFFIAIDCCAGLRDFKAEYVIELTQTGDKKYRAKAESPVFSIDTSRTKLLETEWGTGQGCRDGYFLLANVSGLQILQRYIIFGFGKVGRGVAEAFKEKILEQLPTKTKSEQKEALKNYIIVIEPENLTTLKQNYKWVTFIHPDQKNKIIELLQNSVVITATGIENLISNMFEDVTPFQKAKHRLNIGSENEWGDKFPKDSLLGDGKPINFVAMEKATAMYLLDGVFYLTLLTAHYLTKKEPHLEKSVYSPPDGLDLVTLNRWQQLYNKDVTKFFSPNFHLSTMDIMKRGSSSAGDLPSTGFFRLSPQPPRKTAEMEIKNAVTTTISIPTGSPPTFSYTPT